MRNSLGRSLWASMVVTLSAAVLVSGCTSDDESAGRTSATSPVSPKPSPPSGRVVGACDFLVKRPYVRALGSSKKINEGSDDEGSSCMLGKRVETPAKGYFHFIMNVDSIYAFSGTRDEAIEDAREHLMIKSTTPKLEPCVGDFECWLLEPDCSNTDPDAPQNDEVTHGPVAKGLAYPYKVEINAGVWPDNTENLCEVDNWSRKLLIRMFKDTLKHLADRSLK